MSDCALTIDLSGLPVLEVREYRDGRLAVSEVAWPSDPPATMKEG